MPQILMPIPALNGALGDDTAQPGAAPNGMALFVGLAVGLAYWWMGQRQQEREEDLGEQEDDEAVERPRRVARLSDVTTDRLIDEPAVVASSGRAGDCYKAVKMLPGRQSLATSAHEKSIFRRVLKSVADDCREHEEAIDDALEDLEETREEIEDILGVDSSNVSDDPERNIAARHAAQKAVREGSLTRTRRKKVPASPEIDILDRAAASRGASARGGRPRGASLLVRRPGGQKFRLKKEKAPTKRGFKWRKELVE